MTTASTLCPPSSSYSVLVVMPRSASTTATGRSEVMRSSLSIASRRAFGTSRMAAKLSTPRASHDQTCFRRYAAESWAASHASNSEADIERTGVIATLGYRRFEDFPALAHGSVPALAHKSVVDELFEVRAKRHLGGEHELLAEVSVDPLGQLARRAG